AKVPATGNRMVGQSRSTGEVTFFNRLDTAVVLPAGTRLLADTGARFTLDSEVHIPPLTLSGVKARVTAVDPGTIGNVYEGGINRIEGQVAPGITVRNEKELTGGVDGEERSVSADDIGHLREM